MISERENAARTLNGRATEAIRCHWDRRAETFDDEAGQGLVSEEQRQAWLELLSRLAGPAPQRVLDVGCGTGFLALRLAELGHEVTAVDLSPQMINRARGKAEAAGLQIDFRVGNAVELDCADGTYSLVVARHVIWLLPDPEQGVAEWLRVLRPGGRLALVEGKWGDASETSPASPASIVLSRLKDAVSELVLRTRAYPARLLHIGYRRVKVSLPFSGGPSAVGLAEFLEAHSVHEVAIEPLMDPVLWGGPPPFYRYLATGTRAPDA